MSTTRPVAFTTGVIHGSPGNPARSSADIALGGRAYDRAGLSVTVTEVGPNGGRTSATIELTPGLASLLSRVLNERVQDGPGEPVDAQSGGEDGESACEHCGHDIELDGDTWRDQRGDPGCGANRGGHSPVRCERCGSATNNGALCAACEDHNADRVVI